MLLAVDRHNGVPAYRQIMDQMKFQVAAGSLPAGSELPSTRNLAEQLALNPMTVSKAYNLLEREGVITRRPGMLLVVSAANARSLAQTRTQQLRQCLRPGVIRALQLGASPAETRKAFVELLREQSKPEASKP